MKLNLDNLKKEDLDTKLQELRMELMKTNTKMSSGAPLAKGQGNVKNIKKNIARVKTKLTEVAKNNNE